MSAHRRPPSAEKERAFSRFDPRQARHRLLFGLGLGLSTAAAFSGQYDGVLCMVLGFCVGGSYWLVTAWTIIARATAQQTQRRAAAEDPGRRVLWATVLVSSSMGMLASVVAMRRAQSWVGLEHELLVAACLATVVIAWLLTHTTYTLHYAHLFYRDGQEHGAGLAFPGTSTPCDQDFAYFAFTLGMCFQVSDVTISSSLIRRAVLGHALLSFAFNTAVLAIALNLVIGTLG